MSTVSSHECGDPLTNATLSLPIHKQRKVRMTVDVDEPWAHVMTRCVVCFMGCDVTICADPYDCAVFDHAANMFGCYGGLILYCRSRGGYQPVRLE